MDSYSIYQPFVETITILLEGMVLIGAYCRNGSRKEGIREVLNMVEWLKAQDNQVCVIGDLNARCDLVYDTDGHTPRDVQVHSLA